MSYRDSDERAAGRAAGFVLAGLFFAVAGIVRRFNQAAIPLPKGTPIGERLKSWGGGSVGIPPEERCKHAHVIGPTGSGKTTLLKNLIVHDLQAGHGLAVIDPKGDLVEEVLTHVPPERVEDVILFDPTDYEHPVGFNVLASVAEPYRSRTASEVVSVFKKLFADSWGPRLEHILRYTVLTLLEVPGSTLLDIPELLGDAEYRRALLAHVTNFAVRTFWEREYNEASSSRKSEAIWPILNKIGPWLAYPEVRNIIGQVQSSFQLRDLMDQRKILLVNIPQGLLGEDTSALLGAMLVSNLQLAAMTRAGLPEPQKTPFFLYVDEFQNFVTSAFEKILTEARSFGLGLIVANQFPEQLSKDLALALEKNVAVRLSCYVEQTYHRVAYQRLQDPQAPELILQPLPPPKGGNKDLPQQIRAVCRRRYGRPRKEVENLIVGRMTRRQRRDKRRDHGDRNGDDQEPPFRERA